MRSFLVPGDTTVCHSESEGCLDSVLFINLFGFDWVDVNVDVDVDVEVADDVDGVEEATERLVAGCESMSML